MIRTIAAIAMISFAPLAHAQQGAAGPDPEKIELAQEFMEVMQIDATIDGMMDGMIPQIMAAQGANLTADQRNALELSTREAMGAVMPDYIDYVAVLYADIYTVEEMQALIDFYSGPLGASIIEKMNGSAAVLSQAASEYLIPRLQAEMLTRLCARIACPALPN